MPGFRALAADGPDALTALAGRSIIEHGSYSGRFIDPELSTRGFTVSCKFNVVSTTLKTNTNQSFSLFVAKALFVVPYLSDLLLLAC